ncbi:MAG: RNA polymerase factor sigma-54, partial [Muribaculaceae bacterium]|nr:RNA polymerase factor sigma-54 [Muribaculaceae bacterium]
EAFDKVRAFDPAGVGAVDLRDCLLLQLKRKKTSENVKLAIEIISDYFDLFSKMHYDKLCSLLNIGQQQLKEAIEEIRTLNPKPGSSISESLADERARHIIPDFSVDVDGGNITLTLLNNIPDLQIESTFAEDSEVTISSRQYDAMAFIKQKRDEAKGFMQVLKMRQETLYRVMSAIIKIQREFFLTEDESLIRPMILKDVKALTGYDMSVISRAVTGKYVTTARGVYPLKLFFNERPKDDDDTSFHEIQAVLKEIIDAEDKNKPLSDKAITEALTKRGYDIARRTVAKYRERMGFPVARLRKTI